MQTDALAYKNRNSDYLTSQVKLFILNTGCLMMMAIDGDDGDDDDDDKLIIFPPKADENFMKMRYSLQMISMISSNTKIYNEGSFSARA